MANFIQRTFYERPSIFQDAPLNTIPLDLPRDLFETEHWPAIEASLRVFAAPDRYKLHNEYLTQPDFAWVSEAVGINFAYTADLYPGIEQELRSFRLWDTLPHDKFERTDHPQDVPLWTIPLDLPRDLFETAFWPALEQHRSFRAISAAENPQANYYQNGRTVAAFFWETVFYTAVAQLNSFRTPERPKLELALLEQPAIGWLTAVLGLPEPPTSTYVGWYPSKGGWF